MKRKVYVVYQFEDGEGHLHAFMTETAYQEHMNESMETFLEGETWEGDIEDAFEDALSNHENAMFEGDELITLDSDPLLTEDVIHWVQMAAMTLDRLIREHPQHVAYQEEIQRLNAWLKAVQA